MHPYRWHILVGIGFLMAVTFVFFGFATKKQEKVSVVNTNTVTEISTPTISIADPQIGKIDAAVTIVEFADFSCTACKTTSTTLAQLLNKHPDDVRVIWKDFPNESKSTESTPAAVAARCAAEQGAFWQFHDELFLRQDQLGSSTYSAIASALSLDTTAFASCVATNSTLPRVRKAFEEGLALRITATPTLYINGERYTGGVSLDELETIVKGATAKTK